MLVSDAVDKGDYNTASSTLNLLNPSDSGSSESVSTFTNFFKITGTSAALVPVTFIFDYGYGFNVFSDIHGIWDAMGEFVLNLVDIDDLINDTDNVDNTVSENFQIGDSDVVANFADSNTGSLVLTAMLQTEKNYRLNGTLSTKIAASNDDLTTPVDVAEPGIMALMAMGLGFVGCARRKRAD